MSARQQEKLRRQRERVEALKREQEDTLAIVQAMLGVEARASVRMSHAEDEPRDVDMPQRWEGDDS